MSSRDLPPTESSITEFYADPAWRFARVRYDAIKKSGGRCECCGAEKSDGVRLVVDHIEPIRYRWSRRYDPSNLQVLCDECNRGKGSRDATDWRGPNRTRSEHAPSPSTPITGTVTRPKRRRTFLADPRARSLDAYLGSQGCRSSEIDTMEDLLDVASKAFRVPNDGSIVGVFSAVAALSKKERRDRAARSLIEFWPHPNALWPDEAKARHR